jgi:hypothetical protein
MAEDKNLQTINFSDRNAVEKLLESKKFRPCANLRCAPVRLQHQQLFMPQCDENRFDRQGIAKCFDMPNTQVRNLSPVTYMSIPSWAPFISCPPDCKGYRNRTVAKAQKTVGQIARWFFGEAAVKDSRKKGWWETWWGQAILLIVTGVIVGLVVWGITRHYDKLTPPTPGTQPAKQPEPQATQPREITTPSQTRQQGDNKKKDKIEQHGTGNGAISGNVTTGPCSNVLVGGNNNQASVNCDTSRRLTQQQIAATKSAAHNFCPALPFINVTASNANQEAQRYAHDFIEALKGAGCKADLVLPTPGLTPDVVGIIIGVRDYDNIDPSAKALGTILSSAQLPFTFAPMKSDFFPAEAFVLVIGAKSDLIGANNDHGHGQGWLPMPG